MYPTITIDGQPYIVNDITVVAQFDVGPYWTIYINGDDDPICKSSTNSDPRLFTTDQVMGIFAQTKN